MKTLSEIIDDLRERVTDFPGDTCPVINSVQEGIREAEKALEGLEGMRLEEEAAALVKDALSALYHLDDRLESLRNDNSQLRGSLHEALDSRKQAAEDLEDLVG